MKDQCASGHQSFPRLSGFSRFPVSENQTAKFVVLPIGDDQRIGHIFAVNIECRNDLREPTQTIEAVCAPRLA